MISIDRNVLLLSLGRFVQAVFAILTVRLLTELLPQEQVGQQYLINSMILWFSMVLINPVGMFVNRHLHEWKNRGVLVYYMKQMNKYFLFVSTLSIPIIFSLIYFKIIENLDGQTSIVVYFALYIFMSTWFQTLVSLFNLFDRQKIFIFINIFAQFLGLCFAAVSSYLFQPTALSWLYGLLSGQIVSLFIGLYFFKKYFYLDQKSKDLTTSFFNKETLLFCYPVAITTLFMWFNTQGYRLFIEHDLGLAKLASLGVGLGLAASVSSVVESITTQFYYPEYYKSLANSDLQGRAKSWMSLWKKALAVYIPFCFLTISASVFLVRMLTSSQFHHVYTIVCIGALIELLRQLSNIAYLVAHGEKKTQHTVMPYAVGAMVCLSSLFLLKRFSFLTEAGVAFVLILSGVIVCVLNLYTALKLIHKKIDFLELLKVSLLSSPILIGWYFSSQNDQLFMLFLLSCLSGFICLGVVFSLKGFLKKHKNICK